MLDLTPVQQFIREPDTFTIEYVPHEIKSVGLNHFLERSLKYLDCTRVWSNGMRPMQTIGYPYINEITQFVHTVKTYVEESEQDSWLSKLLEQHNINVEYEKTNPPIWYGGDKAKDKFDKDFGDKPKTRRRKTKQSELGSPDAPKKMSAAERKLAAKVAKINSLSINIKPIN